MNFDFQEMLQKFGSIKTNMENAQKRLASMSIKAEAGAGMVRITLNGANKVQAIEIDDSLFLQKDKAMLEEMLISAFHEAQKKVQEAVNHEMKNAAGGINIPGLSSLLGL